jgi:DNA-binding transcriptional ArsR family regulator
MRDTVSNVFAALADPTRRAIYDELLIHPIGRTATELAASSEVSRQAIVKHLQVLARSGLADARRDGREVLYVATSDGTVPASAWMADRSRAWDRRLSSLEERIRSDSKTKKP